MATSGFKHLVVVKFKEDAKVDEILKGLENLVAQIDTVKSFEWFVIYFIIFQVIKISSFLDLLLINDSTIWWY